MIHEVKKIAAQGDVLFRRVKKLPEGVVEREAKGRIVVAHSETGHDHAIDDMQGVHFYGVPNDPMVCYLMLDGGVAADVVHHRPFDTHETLRLLGLTKGKACWEIRRQREYTPQGWRRVED